MTDIDVSIVKKTQETLGKFIKRPQLTEKLLLRPPFRFIHDIVTMVIKETGFLEGLYSEEELNSDNVKDRDAKTQFLDKLINVVKIVTEQNLTVRSAKIVAGSEIEKTNELLQAIGLALEKQLNSQNAVEMVKSGNIPKLKITSKTVAKNDVNKKDGATTKPSKTTNGTIVKDEKGKAKSVAGGIKTTKPAITSNSKKVPENNAAKVKEKSVKDKPIKPGAIKSTGNKAVAPTTTLKSSVQNNKDAKTGRSKEKEAVPKLVEQIIPIEALSNGHVDSVEPTEEPKKNKSLENLALGEEIVEEKPIDEIPPLPEPPIEPVIPMSLEQQFEPKVESSRLLNFKRSDTQDELSAIIDAEAEIRKTEKKAKRSAKHSERQRLSSGNENEKLSDETIDQNSNSVTDIKSNESTNKASFTPPVSQSEIKTSRQSSIEKADETPPIQEKPRTARKPAKEKVEQNTPVRGNTRTIRQASMETAPTVKERPSYVRQPTEIDSTAIRPRTSLRPPSVRPPSARPAAPRRREKNIEIILQPEEAVKLGAINVKMESFNTDLEDDGENLIIIEDPTVILDNLTQDSGIFSGAGTDAGSDMSGQQQGHLVQQILETQTQFSNMNEAVAGEDGQRKTEIEWDSTGQKQTYTKQMESIRDSIQKITRSVNPLGKLMDFLQEDIDSMQRELELWQDRFNQTTIELNKEKEYTLSAMDPLRHQLAQIEDSIKEHKDLIDISRANILQNEQKIFKLLTEM